MPLFIIIFGIALLFFEAKLLKFNVTFYDIRYFLLPSAGVTSNILAIHSARYY